MDTLNQVQSVMPGAGARLALAVIVLAVLAITALLIYAKKSEADRKAGIGGKTGE